MEPFGHLQSIILCSYIGCVNRTTRETAIQWLTIHIAWNRHYLADFIAGAHDYGVYYIMQRLLLLDEMDTGVGSRDDFHAAGIEYLREVKLNATEEFDKKFQYNKLFTTKIHQDFIHDEKNGGLHDDGNEYDFFYLR